MRRASSDVHDVRSIEDVEIPVAKETWQMDAYSFAEAIGEVGYSLNLKANTVGQCRMRPEVRVPGTDEWEETDDPRVLRVLNAFKPPSGDQGELLRQASLHWDIAGDTWLTGFPVKDERDRPSGFIWEFLSTLELKVEGKGKVLRNAYGGSQGREQVQLDAYASRLHHRDPRFSGRADSPMRRVLPICRELVLLTQVIDAIAKTRLSAGILFIPWEVSFGPQDEFDDPGLADQGFDEFEEELARHLNSPIEDNTSPSRLLPLLMRGPALVKDKPLKDLVGIIELTRELDGLYKELRQEALTRLAGGLDMPPEMLYGKADLNHWTGYNVDADFIANHVVPTGDVIVDFVSAAYCRPMLVTFEGMTKSEAEWFRFALDPSPITANVDRSDNATVGYGLDITSEEAWVRLNGMDEQDIASPEEKQRRFLERLTLGQPALGAVTLPVIFPDDPQIKEMAANWPAMGQAAPGGAEGAGGLSMPTARPLPDGVERLPTPRDGGDEPPAAATLRQIDHGTFMAVCAAADRELDAGLTRAANRLISRLNGGHKPDADRLRAGKKTDVLTMAGRDLATKVGLGPDALFHDCWEELMIRVAQWLRVDLVRQGADQIHAEQRAALAAAELGRQLTLHAGSALDRSLTVGRDGFKIPTALVESALAAGDLLSTS